MFTRHMCFDAQVVQIVPDMFADDPLVANHASLVGILDAVKVNAGRGEQFTR